MERLWRERSPPLPQWETLVRPGQTPAATPAPVTEREPDRKVKRIKLTGSLAHSSGGGSASVPSPAPLNALASTSAAPSPSTPSLTLKFGGGRLNPSLAPSAAPQWAGDVPVAGPASQSPSMITGDVPVVPAGPSTSTDVLVAGAPPKGAALEGGGGDEETKHPSIPTIPDVESGWLAGPAVRPSSCSMTHTRHVSYAMNRLAGSRDASSHRRPIADIYGCEVRSPCATGCAGR